MPTIKVIPIRGSGWVIGGVSREEVPKPFVVALQFSGPKDCSGIVLDGAHEFVGARARLVRRDDDWTGEVEIIVEPSGPGGVRSTGAGVVGAAPRPLL